MEIFEKLKPNTTIITPNRRLTSSLLTSYQTYQLTKKKVTPQVPSLRAQRFLLGVAIQKPLESPRLSASQPRDDGPGELQKKLCWTTLDILPYQSWIQRMWESIAITHMNLHHMILSNHQEQTIWESIVQQSPKNDSLLQLSATAELAKSAWGILKQWEVDIRHPMLNMTEDSLAFQEWALTFQEHCENNHWIDFNTLVSKIIDFIKNKMVTLPDEIIVAGFTELSPIQQTLLNTCETQGTHIKIFENLYSSDEPESFYCGLPDYETELTTMARWAKYLLDHDARTTSLKIGCIIPNLENNRDRVVQIFSAVLSDENFNISAGKSLASYPIIYAAIQILQLHHETISIEKLGYLLRTPFLGEAEKELTKRAAFDCHLRNENITTIPLKNLAALDIEKYCPYFAKRIFAFNPTETESLPPSEWVNHMMERLSILGWPGERSINSQEYQIVQRFLDLLNEYKTFDTITPKICYFDAIQHIQRLATKTIFQPQSIDAPVQILGLLEAANLPFHYTWVVGLDDSAWPPHAKPNPFIPHKLQKSLQMPHATAEKELSYSAKLTAQLKQSTDTIIFSHALKLGDCDLRPSALISDCHELTLNDIKQSDFMTPAEIIYQSKSIESLNDEQAPAVLNDEKLKGGVNIFKQQAACAFKAFAEIRLHAKKLELPNIGLRAKDRGTMTHKALELLWKQIKDHDTLVQLNDDELKQIIENCAHNAITLKAKNVSSKVKYLSLESDRLKNLLWNWLNLEKKRPPFKVISNEEERKITIGNIPLNLRVDRIDQLENGDHLVIDYKTGKYNSIKYWFGDRPEEPQLPLYCLSDPENVKAIAFGELHPDKLTLNGISQSDIEIDKIKALHEINHSEITTWEDQIESWRKIFEKLAHEFLQGNAQVSPKHKIETCQYCDFKPLCRIHEQQVE
jgi:ATP-dependent helicase/nuclease subunit B